MKRPNLLWFAFGSLLLALALFTLSSVAFAQPRSDAAARVSLDGAKRHMEQGQELFAQRKYADAAEAFASAYADEPYAAFLYNEAVCYQKLGRGQPALDRFRKYLAADPSAPDAEQVRARILRLEAIVVAESVPVSAAEDAAAPLINDAGADGSAEAAALDSDAALPDASETVMADDDPVSMKSLVLVESEPLGAPAAVYMKSSASSSAFEVGKPNPGWTRVASGSTPLSCTLDVGRYHIVIEPFADFHSSETDIDVAAGRVHQFKANLRQGEFLAFLRVASSQTGARVYLDDPPPHRRPPWGVAPHEGMIGLGVHQVWVARAGFVAETRKFAVAHGEQREELIELQRSPRGILRFEANAAVVAIEIDGVDAGTFRSGEPYERELPFGPHKVIATSDGRKRLTATLEVPRGKVQRVELMMMPTTPRGGAWTQAFASSAFLGGGAFLGMRANAVHDELKVAHAAGSLTTDDDRYTRGTIFAVGADACFGIGGVLALLSTYSFLKETTPPSSVRFGPATDYPDGPRHDPTLGVDSHRLGSGARASGPGRPLLAPSRVLGGDIRILPLSGVSAGGLLVEGRF